MKSTSLSEGLSHLLGLLFRIKLRKEFVFVFFQKEGKALLGRGLVNFWFLIIIFFLTFLSIGFANGSLEYLHQKMAVTFVHWVTVQVPFAKSEKIDQIMKELREDSVHKAKFKYRALIGYNFIPLYFWDLKKDMSKSAYGRTIEIDDPLMKEIMKKSNLVEGIPFTDRQDIGLIVTEKLLRTLNYDLSASFIFMAFGDGQDDREIALPIRAVVKELPGITDFLTTPYFYDQREVDVQSGGNPFLPSSAQGICLLSESDSGNVARFSDELQSYLKSVKELTPYSPFVFYQRNGLGKRACFQVNVTLWADTSLKMRDNIYALIKNNKDLPNIQYFRFYNYLKNLQDIRRKDRHFDCIAVEFITLDEIRDFKTFLLQKYDIDIDMAQVETLDNYNFVTKLTGIICVILMIFSILSICLFVSNLLRNHLEKIKMNIGTFLAFGINYKALERIYLSIIYIVMIVSMVIGLILAWLIGSFGTIRYILLVLQIKLEENQNYFQQFTRWTFLLIAFVLIISYIVVKNITNRIFKKTPGDLLYDRV